jgi:hypothetical protein
MFRSYWAPVVNPELNVYLSDKLSLQIFHFELETMNIFTTPTTRVSVNNKIYFIHNIVLQKCGYFKGMLSFSQQPLDLITLAPDDFKIKTPTFEQLLEYLYGINPYGIPRHQFVFDNVVDAILFHKLCDFLACEEPQYTIELPMDNYHLLVLNTNMEETPMDAATSFAYIDKGAYGRKLMNREGVIELWKKRINEELGVPVVESINWCISTKTIVEANHLLYYNSMDIITINGVDVTAYFKTDHDKWKNVLFVNQMNTIIKNWISENY